MKCHILFSRKIRIIPSVESANSVSVKHCGHFDGIFLIFHRK